MTDKNGIPYQLDDETWTQYLLRLNRLGHYVNWKPGVTEYKKPQEQK